MKSFILSKYIFFIFIVLGVLFLSKLSWALSTNTEYYSDDLDGILKKKVLRVLVVYDGVNYYFVDGHQDGLAPSLMYKLKKILDEEFLKKSKVKFDIQFIPVREDKILSFLKKGIGDIAANFNFSTQIDEKDDSLKLVYTHPIVSNISFNVVTRKGDVKISNIKDLSGMTVYVRKSSKAYLVLKALNIMYMAYGIKPINIVTLSKILKDSELLKSVQQGDISATVISSTNLSVWKKIFIGLNFHEKTPLTKDNSIFWVVRKSNPMLLEKINSFIDSVSNLDNKENKKLFDEHLNFHSKTITNYSKGEKSENLGLTLSDFKKYKELFQKYGKMYGLDWRLILCQAYQESSLNQNAKSSTGAIGLLQVSPSLAKEFLKGEYAIGTVDGNVQAGTMYLRYIIDNYFNDVLDSYNRTMFALAGYNAGPGRISMARRQAKERGLDHNVWFGNVEKIVAEKGLTETVDYVSKIMKRYQAYKNTEENKK